MRGLKIAAMAALLAVPVAASPDPVEFGSGGSRLVYVVIGDSTGAGVGAPYESGIAIGTARYLAQTHRVAMTNFSISGARTKGVLEKQVAGAAALKPDVVLLTVGANDVTHLTPVWTMRRALGAIVKRLRAANPAVSIIITGSPDMGSPPRIPRLLRGIASWRTKAVNRMFVAEARKLGLTFAPIAERTGPLFRRDRSLFEADRFHPNARGYATWIPVINEALAKRR
jgi:lysophospholipase L1-like esterase